MYSNDYSKTEKSELEKTVSMALTGPPEIRASEKSTYLGEFEERVLHTLSKEEVKANKITETTKNAFQDQRAKKVIVHRDLEYKEYHKFLKLAKENHLHFTLRYDPDFTGEIGLVVVSDQAIK